MRSRVSNCGVAFVLLLLFVAFFNRPRLLLSRFLTPSSFSLKEVVSIISYSIVLSFDGDFENIDMPTNPHIRVVTAPQAPLIDLTLSSNIIIPQKKLDSTMIDDQVPTAVAIPAFRIP